VAGRSIEVIQAGQTYLLCMQELDRGDLQAAQVYATLSLEEAM
jgi:hypothetical protein